MFLLGMQTSRCGVHLALSLTNNTSVRPRPLPQEKIAGFAPEDFVLSLGGPDPDNAVDGVQVRPAVFQTFPALEGQGLTMGVFNVDACAVNPPHTHPRAAEVSMYPKCSVFPGRI